MNYSENATLSILEMADRTQKRYSLMLRKRMKEYIEHIRMKSHTLLADANGEIVLPYDDDYHVIGLGAIHELSDCLDSFSSIKAVIELVNPKALFEDAVHIAMKEALHHRITISSSLDSDLPLTYGDPLLIVQCITSLIKRAANALVEGEHITISASCQPKNNARHIELMIKDNGSGIPEHRRTILNMPEVDGFDLNLAAVRRMIHHFKGALTSHDEWNTGSTVILSIPIRSEMDHFHYIRELDEYYATPHYIMPGMAKSSHCHHFFTTSGCAENDNGDNEESGSKSQEEMPLKKRIR